jgi:hypothetical protein
MDDCGKNDLHATAIRRNSLKTFDALPTSPDDKPYTMDLHASSTIQNTACKQLSEAADQKPEFPEEIFLK